MYKAILFDLDGTLLDTTEGVLFAVKKTIQDNLLYMPPNDILITFVGPPMQLSFKKHLGMSDDEALRIANEFRMNYKRLSLFKAKLYPDTIETLRLLKENGYKISVATNKSEENALKILRYFKIADYCDSMVGSDLQGKLNKSDIIIKSCEEMEIKIAEGLYVGDSIFDLEGAKKVGMDFIGVNYGFGFKPNEDIGYPLIGAITELVDIVDNAV